MKCESLSVLHMFFPECPYFSAAPPESMDTCICQVTSFQVESSSLLQCLCTGIKLCNNEVLLVGSVYYCNVST